MRAARSARTARRKSPPAIPAVAKRQRTASSSSAGRARTASDASQCRSPSPPSPSSPSPHIVPAVDGTRAAAGKPSITTTAAAAPAALTTPVTTPPTPPRSPTPSESDNDEDVDQFAQYGYSSSFSATDTDVSGEDDEARSDCTGRPLFEGATARNTQASHRKRPLDPDWKRYRRGIEWRCRWLELRMTELRALAQRYEDELARIASRDQECTTAGSQDHHAEHATPSGAGNANAAAGCDPQAAGPNPSAPANNQRQYKCRRREQSLPETAPRNHPLFSRLDKTVGRCQRVQEDSQDLAAATTATAGSAGSLPTTSARGGSQQRKPVPSPEQHGNGSVVHNNNNAPPPNPMEELCDQIDAVQQRVEVLLYQLQQHKASQGS